MVLKVPILKELIFHEDTSGIWIDLSSFVKLLKENHVAQDQLKEIRPANIQRELKDLKKNIDGQTFVSLTGIIRYCYNHCPALNICQQIVNQINDLLLGGKKAQSQIPCIKTCQDLYDEISIHELKHGQIEEILHQSLHINEHEIKYLVIHHKSRYSVREWMRICHFELHFEREAKAETYEDLLQEKWNFWRRIQSISDLSQFLNNQGKQIIIRRNERKKAASTIDMVKLWVDNQMHMANQIDHEEYQQCIDLNINVVKEIISFDCVEHCKHQKGIHFIVELSDRHQDSDKLEDIAVILRGTLRRKHNVTSPVIAFVLPASLQRYKSVTGSINRFSLRDAYIAGKLADITEHASFVSPDEYEVETDECESCRLTDETVPLHWKTFSVLQEWQTDVPLIIQCILEPFINRNTLKKTADIQNFLKQKITALYFIYDVLLNTMNRTYVGILQQRNTDELIMHYKSVNTVFEITSESGTTLSLKEAERQLRERANPELCYYNTYLRRYSFPYETIHGTRQETTCFRDCILILMLDNLVRLRFHSDPSPGESRSSQICTLPITIKGIPKDSNQTLAWHDEKTCDGSLECNCYKRRKIKQDEGMSYIMQLSEEERLMQHRFKQLLRWSFVERWRDIKIEPKLKNLIPGLIEEEMEDTVRKQTDEMEELETSMMSLDISSCSREEHSDEFELSLQSMKIESEPSNNEDSDDSDIVEGQSDEKGGTFAYGEMKELPTSAQYDNEEEIADADDIDLFEILNANIDFPDEPSRIVLEIEKRNLDELKNVFYDVGEPANIDRIQELEPFDLASHLGFQIYHPPQLLCRHPPPETGRDDDETKLKEILDDVLTKSGFIGPYQDGQERILFAPDHKIGKNLLSLMSKFSKYQKFLPEFPILHLRKSRICNIFSGYKQSGLIHILKYMRDDHTEEWSKLLSERCIDDATNVIYRISLSLHLAFVIRFCQYLPKTQTEGFMKELDEKNYPSILSEWDQKFEDFLEKGMNENATFALHLEIMNHCDEILAIAFSERIGGPKGYDLLLSAVKDSLPYAFLNGATSYASYTTLLLHEHFTAGTFHQNFKRCLFTTPHKYSNVNFGLDSQREMDHRDVMKGFRSGSSLKAIIPRMSLIDDLNEAHENRRFQESSTDDTHPLPFTSISNTDLRNIIPCVELIIRRNALCMETNIIPFNVYAKKEVMLSTAILDSTTNSIGEYLIKKYITTTALFGQTKDNFPEISKIDGPPQLIRRIKQMKGTVINRTRFKLSTEDKTERELAEEKRVRKVQRLHKNLQCLSSTMNACQAIVKPDCSKPKVMKASGIQQALTSLLIKVHASESLTSVTSLDTPKECELEQLSSAGLVWLKARSVPANIRQSVKFATVEFAGAKFKCKVPSGAAYITFVENSILKPVISMIPAAERIVVCEEKYSYTPDDFKAATREQRKKSTSGSIAHLKTGEDIISSGTFVKEAVISTQEGKIQISTFLAKNAQKLNIRKNIIIDFDSELLISGCNCKEKQDVCLCTTYAVPLRCQYTEEKGFCNSSFLHHIKQRKGEAEMAQVDWLIENMQSLQEGENVLSIVTSGDIDAIVIHMFALSLLWPRNQERKFKNHVYVMLQKPGKVFDMYNITGIIEFFENQFKEVNIGIKIGLILCLGGNDFLPKFYGISHKKILETCLKNEEFFNQLFTISIGENTEILVNKNVYKELMKTLYCPKKCNPKDLSIEEVRKRTVFHQRRFQRDTLTQTTRNPQLWMPPVSALEQLVQLLECQIKYLLSAGHSNAEMPDFLMEGCLQKTESGEIEYNLGPDTFVGDVEQMFGLPETLALQGEEVKRKRKQNDTPQKGSRKKLTMTSTPRKKQI